MLETPKPKRKTTRQNVQTEPNSDDSAPEEADRYGEQKAAAVGTIKGKKAKKSKDVADLVQLASRAHDEEGILRYLKFVYPGGWREKRSIVADLKRVHVLNKSLCGKEFRCVVLAHLLILPRRYLRTTEAVAGKAYWL